MRILPFIVALLGCCAANAAGVQEAAPPYINVLNYGFSANNGVDNSPKVSTLMASMNTGGVSGGYEIAFPPLLNATQWTDYYFTQPFSPPNGFTIDCHTPAVGSTQGSTRLIFAAGQDGVVLNSVFNRASLNNCGVVSMGFGQAQMAAGVASVTSVSMTTADGDSSIPVTTWGPGDGIMAITQDISYRPTSGLAALAVPPGAYVTAAAGGTLTLATGFEPLAGTGPGGGTTTLVLIYNLPAALKYTVQTTIGSNSITVTGGPRLIIPGELIWSDAFPFGATVNQTSGTVGAQTITVVNQFNSGNYNASVTHTSGSPGQMWIVPAGMKRVAVGFTHSDSFFRFPLGISMDCSSGTTPTTNCSPSRDDSNVFEFDLIGRYVAGDNTGASQSLSNLYTENYIHDIIELGQVGSNYVGDNSNSREASRARDAVVGNCANQNFGSYINMYVGGWGLTSFGSTGFFCVDQLHGIGASPVAGNGPLVIAPLAGSYPSDSQTIIATGIRTLAYGGWAFASNRTGAIGEGCLATEHWYVIGFSHTTCGDTSATFGMAFSNTYGLWNMLEWNGVGVPYSITFTPNYGIYTGYPGNNSYMLFQNGFLIYDDDLGRGQAPGPERLVDAGHGVPTGAYHENGDIHLNLSAVAGGNLAWTSLAGSSWFTGFISGTTLTITALDTTDHSAPVAIGQTILTGAAAGTKITAGSGSTWTVSISQTVGSSGSPVFMQAGSWVPAGPVANDAAGASYIIGTPVAIGSLPPCVGTSGARATVNNGIATPTYHQTVSVTGSTVQPVACAGGTGWVYD